MKLQQEINCLLAQPWSSARDLRDAIEKACGPVWFDCFEEGRLGEVTIRMNPIGNNSVGFDLRVRLSVAKDIAA